ncbi:Predicted antitoxin, CopG family [Haladaptatus litoreus]|uniref:Predicted antitoxin, CopG family n=1 Tax=Haladaptatus litoreus TaxID=553468 RepID=A0A1N7D9G8_9EURY|nr:antitoxin VapB family protein [Haladaptatus litoreus]SIR72493.1 Predicted antitoxin, CopG family [Haladaptatus litoreus]
MSSKNITLKEEAYESLKAHKRDDESFSDVVLRLSGKNKDIWKGFGMLSDEEADAVRGHVEDVRDQIDEDFTERRDELFRQ